MALAFARGTHVIPIVVVTLAANAIVLMLAVRHTMG
jgi:hypothetical protein